MNFPNISNLFSINLSKKQTPIKENKKGFTFDLKGSKNYQFKSEIGDLDRAIEQAKSEILPSRAPIIQIYDGITDLHLKSQIRTAVFSVTSEPSVWIDENDKIHDEATKLMSKKWWNDLNKHFVRTELYGHSLLYFWINEETGEFYKTGLIKRSHVCPERSSLIPDLNKPDKYVSYEPILNMLLEIGDDEDLGLLKDISRYCILKSYQLSDWARSTGKFGDPQVILQTDGDDAETEKKAAWLANFVNGGFGIVGLEDKLSLLEKNVSGSPHKMFLDFIKLMNEENSKGVNGQTATSDEKAFVGAAEVQERVLNTYTAARLQDLEFHHNEVTIPFLVNYNGGNTAYKILDGLRWMTKTKYEKEILKLEPVINKEKKDENDETNLQNHSDNPFI